MKRLFSYILILVLLLSNSITVLAEDNSREYSFELSVDGSDSKEVKPGDIVTVTFYLERTDGGESYDMYAMQNEIRYDSNFFSLVEGSALLSEGITTRDLGLRDEYREFYMNYLSLSGGEEWISRKLVGSFQLEVTAQSGVSQITNQDYLVSTADGKDHYKATARDVTIVVSTECQVNFQTNGGSDIESQIVQYGERINTPSSPIREGFEFVGWFADIDLQQEWNFEEDTVRNNMTLYAKWKEIITDTSDHEETTPDSTEENRESPTQAADGDDIHDGGDGSGVWWILLLALAGTLLWLLLVLFGKKVIRFETDCDTQIEAQKVKKGGLVETPKQLQKAGKIFDGWYADEARTKRWDFEHDKVEKNMTLYAKWR